MCKPKCLAMVVLSNPGSAAHHSKANSQEISVGRKKSLLYFGVPATGGEGGLLSKNQISVAAHGTGAFMRGKAL